MYRGFICKRFLHLHKRILNRAKVAGGNGSGNVSDTLELSTLLEAIDRLESTFALYDKDFRLLFANKSAKKAWPRLYSALEEGLSQEEAVSQEISAQFPNLPNNEFNRAVTHTLETLNSGRPQVISARGGRLYQTFFERLGDQGIVGIGIDLTELKTKQKQLQQLADENHRLANIDSLTKLSNRRHFVAQIDELIVQRERTAEPFAVAILDLDGFKSVNDVYGHPAGDELLRQAAIRIKAALPDDAIIARLGGDEFGFVYTNNPTDMALAALGQRICNDLSAPFNLDGDRVYVAASIGFAKFPTAATSRSLLFERADFALYHAKENGKNQAVIFSAEHELRIRHQANLELAIRESDVEDEFQLEFQPIFDVEQQTVVGVEALARWHHPSLGKLLPGDFLDVAKSTGQLQRITPTLLRKALSAAKTWPNTLFLAFNLSATEVITTGYVHELVAIANDNGFPPHRLVFEITENAMIRDSSKVVTVLNKLRRHGVRVGLDDFGTGFSSLSHLAEMPLDFLKVDQSFLTSIQARKKAAAAILQSVCDLSKTLQVQTIIEGVETQQQLGIVQKAGVDLVQGFFFSRPMSAVGIERLFAEDQDSPASTAQLIFSAKN